MALGIRRRWKVLAAAGFSCNYCGRSAPEVHLDVEHVYPRARGGTDDPGNLVAACTACNGGKSMDDITEALVHREMIRGARAEMDVLEAWLESEQGARRGAELELRGALEKIAYLEYALEAEREGYRARPTHIRELLGTRVS